MSSWHFVLLFEDIQFLSFVFHFVIISRSFYVRFNLFVAWNIQRVVFPSISTCFCCSICLYIVSTVSRRCNLSVISLFNIICKSSYWCIHSIFNAGDSSSSFFSTRSLCLHSDVRNCAYSLFFLSFCLSPSLVHFTNGSEYLWRGLPVCVSLGRFSFLLSSHINLRKIIFARNIYTINTISTYRSNSLMLGI